MPDEAGSADSSQDLLSKVTEWLLTEGYPLEFTAANILSRNGFRTWQGQYVRGTEKDSVREIDVLASMDAATDQYLLRVYQLIECKWSKSKPWIVFTSRNSRMTESACAAQTVGSEYGTAIMWAIAGDTEIAALDLFHSPERAGFNGRQAFAKGVDRFFNAMKSVTELSTALADEYSQRPMKKGGLPFATAIVFPVILVEGRLFQAYLDSAEEGVKIEEKERVRCHWRGSPGWDYHSTIDIVTLAAFERFCEVRAWETARLLKRVYHAHEQVLDCIRQRSLKPLEVQRGPRGIVGIPPFLRQLVPQKR